MSGRRVEMNPGELFMVADRTILVREYESVLGDVTKIGESTSEVAYFFTFTGRLNHTDQVESVTVAMSPEDAFALSGNILTGLELLVEANRKAGES